jgi:hypothetical protein
MLKPGVYEMAVRDSAAAKGKYLDRRNVEVKGPRTRIRFQIPPQVTCVITLRKLN